MSWAFTRFLVAVVIICFEPDDSAQNEKVINFMPFYLFSLRELQNKTHLQFPVDKRKFFCIEIFMRMKQVFYALSYSHALA